MKLLRDPNSLTELALELREHADNLEDEAKNSGNARDLRRIQPRLRRIRLAAREMEENANRGGRLDALEAEARD